MTRLFHFVVMVGWLLLAGARADAGRPDVPSAESIGAALAALEDPEFETREKGFERLLDWAGSFPGEMLKSLPEAHDDPEVAHRLGEIRRKIGFLTNPLWKEGLEAAGDTPDPELRGALEAFSASPSAVTITGLARAAGPHARLFWRVYAAQLDHPDHKVRLLAVDELVRIGATEAAPRIVQTLVEDKHPQVRLRAVKALEQMRCREAIPRFVECMKMNRSFRSVARRAILEIGDPSAVPLLAALLADPLDEVRRDVLKLLTEMETADPSIAPAIVPALAVCLDDPDEQVRFDAASLLGTISGQDWSTGRWPKERIQLAREWWAARTLKEENVLTKMKERPQ